MIKFGMFKKNIWLFLILLVASVLRFVKLDYLELFGDEVDAGYQSYSLMTSGRDYKGHFLPIYIQSFSEWRAPMMMYFMVPFIKLFGLNEIGVRSMPAFFGIVSILGVYFLLLKIGFKKNIALLSAFLISILPWHILYSRAAFEITLMSSFIIWGLYFLILVLEKNKIKYSLMAAILLCLSFYTYNTSNIYVPLLSLLILFLYRKVNKSFFVFVGLSIIFCLPLLWQIIFGNAAERFGKVSVFTNKDLIAEVIEYRNKTDNKIVAKIFYNKPVIFAKKVVSNYLNAFSADFLFGNGDVTFRHSLHKVGNLFWIYSIFIIIGLILIIRSKKQEISQKFILGMLLIAPIPASLTSDGYFHATRLFLMIFPLCVIASIGLVGIYSAKKMFLIPLLFVLAVEFANFQIYYWNHYKNESWRWWHTGYKELISKVSMNENKFEKVYFDISYEPAYSRYLFWNKINPKTIFEVDDNVRKGAVDDKDGFCYDDKCFLYMGSMIDSKMFKSNVLYVLNQENNVGGDWDWSKNAPEGLKVLDTVKNIKNEPLFYLVTKETD